MNARKILHLDLDAFFCAVEELRQPDLRGKAFAVGGRPEERGVVSTCSYAARARGVRSAMPMGRALRLCPEMIILPGNHAAYGEMSRAVMQRLADLTPLVEQISIDEAFLDVSDLPEPAEQLARALQQRIRTELDLPASLGVAANKLVAKIANDVGKAARRAGDQTLPPQAITVVPPGEEAAFLAPLPVLMLWGVGPKTAQRLESLGIHTIGDLARHTESELEGLFGKTGSDLARHARGIDQRPVEVTHEIKSISQEITFVRDTNDPQVLDRSLVEMVESVGRRLRQDGLAGRTVRIKLRWSDFTTLTRQVTLSQPTDQDREILDAAQALLKANWVDRRRVRLIGVGVSGLETPARQLELFDQAKDEHARRLQQAIDELRSRFGKQAIQRGQKGL
jgi:DNA polymerase-4